MMSVKTSLSLGLLVLSVHVFAATEVTDPACYSAGTMSEGQINDWFIQNIREEAFNLWYGKKDRLYLNGAWKARIIDNQAGMSTPLKSLRNVHGHEVKLNAKESQLGEQLGFYKTRYNDQAWYSTALPSLAKLSFPSEKSTKTLKKIPYEVWYRRNFQLPASWKGERIILNFMGMSYRADVYINGKKVGSHRNSRPSGRWWVASGNTDESFAFDITADIVSGKNQITVKNFSPFTGGSGIFDSIYLEAIPLCAVVRALVTPDVGNGRIGLRMIFENRSGITRTVRPTLELKPWHSYRYQDAKWPTQNVTLEKISVPLGRFAHDVTVKLTKPRLWSVDHPALYHLTIKDGKTVIGQERFGFREFTGGRNLFHLNGKAIVLRGEQCGSTSWHWPGQIYFSQFGNLNQAGKIEAMLKTYKGANYNILRSNSMPLPFTLLDVADEIGLLVLNGDKVFNDYLLFDGQTVTLDEPQRLAIERRCLNYYNSPALVLRSMGNEEWDYKFYGTRFEKTGAAPKINAMYDEYKKWDKTRLICQGSGRNYPLGITPEYSYTSIANGKTDFDSIHTYPQIRKEFLEEDELHATSIKSFKSYFAKGHKGREMPMITGESLNLFEHPELDMDRYRQHLKMGELDRAFLVQEQSKPGLNQRVTESGCLPANSFAAGTWGHFAGQQYKYILEMLRRKRPYYAGYIIHVPGTVANFSFGTKYPDIYDAFATAQQPILASLPAFFTKNIMAGRQVATEILLVNDSEDILTDATVILECNGLALASCKFDTLALTELKRKPVSFSLNTPSGQQRLVLKVIVGGRVVSANDYAIHVMAPQEVKLTQPPKSTIYTLGNCTKLLPVFKRLNLDFVSATSLPTNHHAVVFVTGDCPQETLDSLPAWVAAGGKAVCLELEAMPETLVGRAATTAPVFMSEITLKNHPIFRGLSQDNFIPWNGVKAIPNSRRHFEKLIIPMNAGVLLMSTQRRGQAGMAACEYQYGNGRFLFSQMLAMDRFGADSVATRYLLNLLDYTIGDFNDLSAPKVSVTAVRAKSYKVDPRHCFQVNLRPYANMGFTDKVAHDQKGGWSDQGPYPQDASMFPVGEHSFAGVPFEVIKPENNNNKSCIILKGNKKAQLDFYPPSLKNIRVDRLAQKLYFLVASKWTPREGKFANIRVNMQIGVSKKFSGGTYAFHDIPLVGGRNIGDWWNVKDVPEALVGWRSQEGNIELGAFVIEWTNPEPNVQIGSVDFSSDGIGSPILIGITGVSEDKQVKAVPNTPDFSISKDSVGTIRLKSAGTTAAIPQKSSGLVYVNRQLFQAWPDMKCTGEKCEIISATADSKVMRWTSEVADHRYGGRCQLVFEVEMIHKLPVVFVRSRLYNRGRGEKIKASQSWVFPGHSGLTTMPTNGGEVTFSSRPWEHYTRAKDFILYTGANGRKFGIVSDVFSHPKCKFFTNSPDINKTNWWLARNHKIDKLLGYGDYNEVNFVVFSAKTTRDVEAMFAKLNAAEYAPLWRMDD
jgi:beta-galactosidase